MSVIILTLNEQDNIAQALESVCGWAANVFVLDSYSTDETISIARQYTCTPVQHPFTDYGTQRNWALDNLPITTEWVFFLDADEWLTASSKAEISCLINSDPIANGYLMKRKFIWMGKWIRRGYYPTWLLRLFRTGKAHCEDRAVNEHIVAQGKVGRLKYDLIHEDRKGISEWTHKHIEYARREAELMFLATTEAQLSARIFGTPAERMRWVRVKIYNRLPPVLRSLLLFVYHALLRGGFLDGPKAWIYHFLHSFWVPLLTDCFYLELRREMSRKQEAATDQTSRLASYFALEARDWEKKYRTRGFMRKRLAAFTSALTDRVPKGSTVLDFGCGSGDITANYVAAGYKLTGVDQASQMIIRAQERFAHLDISFLLLDPSQTTLPFAARSFDAFTASSVLEYAENYLEWLFELRRVCKRDAVGVVSVPNVQHPIRKLEGLERVLYRVLGKYWPNSKIFTASRPGYLQFSKIRLDEEKWKAELARSGWKCIASGGHRTPLLMLTVQAL